MKFKDPFNPTQKEIMEWAYEEDVLEPEQDFDIYITNSENSNLLFDLATDKNCPSKNYFVKCLYLFVGNHIRTKGKSSTVQEIESILNKGSNSTDNIIQEWIIRTRDILIHPENFSYDLWCDGGYVNG
jgi:hypothetical protein